MKLVIALSLLALCSALVAKAADIAVRWDYPSFATNDLHRFEIFRISKTTKSLVARATPDARTAWLLSVPVGTSTYHVVAVDRFGNVSSPSNETSVVVRAVAPPTNSTAAIQEMPSP